METEVEKNIDEINNIMNEYHEKKNKIGTLYNEYTINYGKEYNMATLANTLLNSFKTEANLGKMRLSKKKKIVKKEYPLNKEKLTNLLNKIDEMNEFLTKFYKIG